MQKSFNSDSKAVFASQLTPGLSLTPQLSSTRLCRRNTPTTRSRIWKTFSGKRRNFSTPLSILLSLLLIIPLLFRILNREFVKICYTALQINGKLITQDQHEYQEVLRENYQKLCQSLSSLFGESLWPDEHIGSFKRNSAALFSAISGANNHTSTA